MMRYVQTTGFRDPGNTSAKSQRDFTGDPKQGTSRI